MGLWTEPRVRRVGIVLGMALALGVGIARGTISLHPGDPFPDIRIGGLIAPEDYGNLGLLQSEGSFLLSEIPGDMLVLELFNKHCRPCQVQVRHVEALFQELRFSGLLERIRLLGLAEGNQAKYFPPFRKKRNLTYPIAADPAFDYWRAFGEPGRTPFTVYLVRRDGVWVLGDAHVGVRDKDRLMTEVLGHLRGEAVAHMEAEDLSREPPAFPERLDPAAEQAIASRLLSRVAANSAAIEIVDLSDGTVVYRSVPETNGGAVYARVARRDPICEVCHGVYFAFAFEAGGSILGFEPIHVGKWGNETWGQEDAGYQETRLRDRVMGTLEFDEEVDAVSRATVSSAIIFDEIRRSAKLLEELGH